MTKTLHGTIRGKTIELADDPGLDDGAAVEVVLRPTETASQPIERLPRLAGSLADWWTVEDDLILQQIQEDRHRFSDRELPE